MGKDKKAVKRGDWEIANKLGIMLVQYNRRGNPVWETLAFKGINLVKQLESTEEAPHTFLILFLPPFPAHTLSPP